MGLRDFILQAISKLPPLVSITIKSLSIGGREYRVENGNIIFDVGGTEDKIPLRRDRSGVWRPVIDGISVEGISEDKEDNVRNLDDEGKIFTRADIGSPQIELLNLGPDELVKAFKPVLLHHQDGRDLGALVAATTIVKMEDAKNQELAIRLHTSFRSAYRVRGAMIYNLLRSGILEQEVLKNLRKLARVLKSNELVKQFVLYWDSLIPKGYPTAYFVKASDSYEDLSAELNWRFNQDEQFVRVFSRSPSRNKNALDWCARYCRDRGYRASKHKQYRLGFSDATRLTIYNKKPLT